MEPAGERDEELGAEGGNGSKRPARRGDEVGQVDGGTEAESATQHLGVSIENIFESDEGQEGKRRRQEDEGIPGGRRVAIEKPHDQLDQEESEHGLRGHSEAVGTK